MFSLSNGIKNISKLIFKTQYYRSHNNTHKDLYQTLGVSRTADQNQLKKAYYKLAQQYHPDKNPGSDAKDKFAEINNAYQTLSDTSKRQMYDQTGSTENPFGGFQNQEMFRNFRGGRGAQGMGFEDIFQEIFGGNGRDGRSSKQGFRQGFSNFAEDISINIDLTFQQSIKGTKKTISYMHRDKCTSCNGNKSEKGTKPQKCSTCKGTGTITMRQGMMILQTTCNTCQGQGQRITNPCKTCRGSGIQNKKDTIDVDFPRGIDTSIRKVKQKGNLGGDLLINVKVKKNPNFKRQGNNVHSEIQISAIEAVLGTTVKIDTIYGDKKQVKIQPGTQNFHQIKLAKEGFYIINSPQKGSHLITVKVKIPKKITNEQKQLYQKLKALSI